MGEEAGDLERELQRHSEREALLLEAERITGVGSWMWDIASNQVAWSRQLFRILGFDPDKDKSSYEAFFSRVHPEDRDRVQDSSARSIESGKSGELRFRILLPDGTVRHASMDGALLFDKNGKVRSAVGTVADITEKLKAEAEKARLEELLHHARKMESLGTLAGGVAHDSNNMLAVILGHASALRAEAGLQGPSLEKLDQIIRAARRSADQVRKLLAFSRRQTIHPVALDLNEAVSASLTMLRPGIGRGMEVRWVRTEGLWPVKVDPGQLDQILANLCVNARDACRGTGILEISVANLPAASPGLPGPELLKSGDYVRLSVRDNGSGMDAQVLARAFEPFYTTKPLGQGTGLGLASVYGSAQQAGGAVVAESRPGDGACFHVFFPRHSGPAQESPPAPPAAAAAGAKPRLLLVDDEADLRRLLKEMLEARGFSVSEAGSGNEALALAERPGAVFDTLISDVAMPGMSGPELGRRLGARYPGLKKVFISGYALASIAEDGMDLSQSSFLQKPFEIEDLIKVLGSPARP